MSDRAPQDAARAAGAGRDAGVFDTRTIGRRPPGPVLFPSGDGESRQQAPGATAVELSSEQIEAANRIHNRLPQWLASLRSASALGQGMPGFGQEAVILKIIATRSLFGGGVHALMPLARHVERVLATNDPALAGPELVEKLAAMPASGGQRRRKLHGFASKFAHFFIDPDRFPVMDAWSAKMVEYHLGPRNRVIDESSRYREFVANFRRLRGLSGFKGRKRELDRYLWVSGQYQVWLKKPRTRINPELKDMFESPTPEAASDLQKMVTSPDTGTAWL